MLAIGHSSDGRVATVTLNRPDKRNALNQELVLELDSALHSLAADEYLRAVILTGAGNVFSAGADLDALDNMQNSLVRNESRRFQSLSKPVSNHA